MIPQTAGQKEMSENAAVVSLKQALEALDRVKEGKAKVFEEAVQKCQNFNAVEQLILVHQGQAEKGIVFEGFKNEFRQLFGQLEPFDKQIAETKGQIQQQSGPFAQLLSSTSNDPAKQQFYQQIDQALAFNNEVTNMLHQAN